MWSLILKTNRNSTLKGTKKNQNSSKISYNSKKIERLTLIIIIKILFKCIPNLWMRSWDLPQVTLKIQISHSLPTSSLTLILITKSIKLLNLLSPYSFKNKGNTKSKKRFSKRINKKHNWNWAKRSISLTRNKNYGTSKLEK